MGILSSFFNILIYKPLLNLLVLLYQYLPGHDFGLAIIIMTVLVRVALYPLNLQAIRAQKALQEIQPKIQEIQKQYKNDKEKLTKATLELYQKGKINPLSGCLPLLIQLPVLIALFWVFQKGLKPEEMKNLYGFVPNPGQIIPFFFGILDLSKPYLPLAILAGVLQFFQTKMMTPKTPKTGGKSDISTMMQSQMTILFPFFTVILLLRLPSAIALYWLITSLFSIFQQYLILKNQKYANG